MDPTYLVILLLLPPLLLFLTLTLITRPTPIKIPIKNRHVFITGGSSGIGLALAHQSALQGARVSILARNPKNLQEAQNSIRLSTGIEVATFSADVRDFESVKRAIDEAGPIDVLICNQGVFTPQELELQDLETIRLMMDVNLMGCFNLVKAALPGMKNRKDRGPGSIAFMSSQAGQVGIYGYTAYSASKFGLRGLGEALQHEVISDNIHVSLIFPPDTETPGLVEENKIKPELTSIIAASSGAMKADEVAQKALNGIKSGTFIVSCNFEGLLLSLATAGLSPQRSSLMAFVEVVAAGVSRFAALFFQWNWYGIIATWSAQKRAIEIEIKKSQNLEAGEEESSESCGEGEDTQNVKEGDESEEESSEEEEEVRKEKQVASKGDESSNEEDEGSGEEDSNNEQSKEEVEEDEADDEDKET